MKKVILLLLLAIIVVGCKGEQNVQSGLSPQLYQSVPGGTHGDLNYDSDKIHDGPANRSSPSERNPYIW